MCDHLFRDSVSPAYLADLSSDNDSQDDSHTDPHRAYTQYTPPSPATSTHSSEFVPLTTLFSDLSDDIAAHRDSNSDGSRSLISGRRLFADLTEKLSFQHDQLETEQRLFDDACTTRSSHDDQHSDNPSCLIREGRVFEGVSDDHRFRHDRNSIGSCSPTSLASLDECRVSPRKQLHPRKSPSKVDPEFQGVSAAWKFSVDEHRNPSLDFEIIYSLSDDWSHRSSPSCRRYLGFTTPECGGDTPYYKRFTNSHGKQCASCNTRKTPLWRDAEDGTPLCNACGIRYKKYRVRCSHCWHIPKKENKSYSRCSSCGDQLKFSMNRSRYPR